MFTDNPIDTGEVVTSIDVITNFAANLNSNIEENRVNALEDLASATSDCIYELRDHIAEALISGTTPTVNAGIFLLWQVAKQEQSGSIATEILTSVLGSTRTSEAAYDSYLFFTLEELATRVPKSDNDDPTSYNNYLQVLPDCLLEIAARAAATRNSPLNIPEAVVAYVDTFYNNSPVNEAIAASYITNRRVAAAFTLYKMAIEAEEDNLFTLLTDTAERQTISHIDKVTTPAAYNRLTTNLNSLGAEYQDYFSKVARLVTKIASAQTNISLDLAGALVTGFTASFEDLEIFRDVPLDGRALVLAWQYSAATGVDQKGEKYKPDFAEAVNRNLLAIEKLEEARPGATWALSGPPFGIANFARYPQTLLTDQYDNMDANLPYIAVFNPKGEGCDWNGAFYQQALLHDSMFRQLQKLHNEGHPQYLIRAFEGASTSEFNKGLILLKHRYYDEAIEKDQQGHRISVLFDSGHGNVNEILRGGEVGDRQRTLTRAQVASSTNFRGDVISAAGAKRFFEPRFTYILNSCSTGELGAIGHDTLQQALNARVLAPRTPAYVDNVTFSFDEHEQLIATATHINNETKAVVTTISEASGQTLVKLPATRVGELT
ncbi:MAG: hypothetical protein NT141_00305 [candidate division WWE3 bacterium]|nr:hypothetical protein [candidate division WWE3 bacterium]